ncbi:hypothetical protein LEP1GSC172_2899 [Leptospira noguchii]|uniref:Uncharacterized protein n=1 Tax=Leptospira noguchii TaxID=28182 RepID=M6VDC2_9LEPT|nr:hypothetical protein LEP1GSC172_2899 [Leptospira noguchii]
MASQIRPFFLRRTHGIIENSIRVVEKFHISGSTKLPQSIVSMKRKRWRINFSTTLIYKETKLKHFVL